MELPLAAEEVVGAEDFLVKSPGASWAAAVSWVVCLEWVEALVDLLRPVR